MRLMAAIQALLCQRPMTIRELAFELDRMDETVWRAVSKLKRAGIVTMCGCINRGAGQGSGRGRVLYALVTEAEKTA